MTSSLPLSPNFNDFSATGNFSRDFGVKLQLKADEEPNMEQEQKLSNQPGIEGDNEDEEEVEEQNEEEEDEEEEEEEEEQEFSFVCLNPDGSPIAADDLFQDGQIRPIFPLFNQDLLQAAADDASGDGDMAQRAPVRKLFVEDSPEESSSEPAGPYCEWRGGRTVTEALSERCRKSNSTGFSKLWRFRDLKLRCSSDGKDAFVFLSHHSSSSSVKTEKKNEKEEKKAKVKGSEETPKTKKMQKSIKTASPSAHEKLYVKNRAQKEGDKRLSYLPYRQVGFFTNVNGLSRNIHPF